MTHKEYIKELLKNKKLKEALDELYAGLKVHQGEKEADKLILTYGQLSSLLSDRAAGILTDESYNISQNKIANAILYYTNEYEPRLGFATPAFKQYMRDQPKPIPTQPPFLALFFANSIDNPLKNIEEEQFKIEEILRVLKNENLLDFISNRQTTIQVIFDALRKHNINWFHYAGHASSTTIKLEDQAAFMNGIIDRLISENQENNVVLVFLNGCSTYDNVRRLLSGGINIVISTSAEVNDKLASEFAIEFYENIVIGQTIKTAYYNAASYIKAKTDQLDINNSATRWSSELGSENDAESNVLPWGLYTNDIDSLDNLSIFNLLDATASSTQPQPSMPQLPNKDNLFDLIDESDFNQVFEILKANKKHFKGYQDLRDIFIYDRPSGLALVRFKDRLKTFISTKY